MSDLTQVCAAEEKASQLLRHRVRKRYCKHLSFEKFLNRYCVCLFGFLLGFLLRFKYKAWWKSMSILAIITFREVSN